MTFPAGVIESYDVSKAVPQTNFLRPVAPLNQKAVTLAYSAAPVPDLSLGSLFTMTATTGVAYVVGVPLSPQAGMRWTLVIRNTSGGVLGAGTFNAVFKTSAGVTAPATGFSRAIEFEFDGTNHVEISRGATDVAN